VNEGGEGNAMFRRRRARFAAGARGPARAIHLALLDGFWYQTQRVFGGGAFLSIAILLPASNSTT